LHTQAVARPRDGSVVIRDKLLGLSRQLQR
jgi:hypothetical protein